MRNILHKLTFGLVLSTDQMAIIQAWEETPVTLTYKGVLAVNKIQGGQNV